MWQSVVIILIGALLALTGWLIGRPISRRSFARSGGVGVPVARFEWLVEDISSGQGLGRPFWPSSFIHNSRCQVRLKRAARRIVAQSPRTMSGPSLSFCIVVRSIGRWTFSSAARDLSHQTGSGGHPGTEFLEPGQMVLQLSQAGADDSVRSIDGAAPGEKFKLIHHAAAQARGRVSVGSYALQSFLLCAHDASTKTDRLLGAHMTALLASQSPDLNLDLIHVASEILGARIGNAKSQDSHREKPLKGREVDDRAGFEELYLKAWTAGALGRQGCDAELISEALGIYKRLMAPGVDAHCGCSGLEGALIAANAAQLALAAFERSGRNPERLLEADEYCARARVKLDPKIFPELFMGIELLGLRIRRNLAVHDRSLPGLLATQDLLDEVSAAHKESGAISDAVNAATLALEEGRLYQARGEMSGDNALIRQAMAAYSNVHRLLSSEKGARRSLMRDAVLGLAQCLISVGKFEGSEKPFRKAIKIIDEALLAGPNKVVRGGLTKSRASRLLDAKLSLSKAEALGALGLQCGEVAHIEHALSHLQNFTQQFEIELPEDIVKRRQLILTRLLLDRADMTDLTLHYQQAVDAIGPIGEDLGLTGAPTGKHDCTHPDWRVEHGYARALAILAERAPSSATLHAAEAQALRLRARANFERDELHSALAEQMVSDILAQKSDAVAGGDSDTLVDAINAMRRALDLTPRAEMPLVWGARQSALGGLLTKHGLVTGGVEGLEAAVSAYEKSLGSAMGEFDQGARATTLIDLGETLNLLSHRCGDKHYKEDAEAAFQHALDVGSSHNLHLQAERAEAALSRLRG